MRAAVVAALLRCTSTLYVLYFDADRPESTQFRIYLCGSYLSLSSVCVALIIYYHLLVWLTVLAVAEGLP